MFTAFRTLYSDKKAQSLTLELAEAVTATVDEYRKTVGQFEIILESAFANKEKDVMHIHIGRVNDLEHQADLVEAKAAEYDTEPATGFTLDVDTILRVLPDLTPTRRRFIPGSPPFPEWP